VSGGEACGLGGNDDGVNGAKEEEKTEPIAAQCYELELRK
jgi:hypothetical protein